MDSAVSVDTGAEAMLLGLRLWGLFLAQALSREMEYRLHLWLSFLIDVVWYAVQVGLFEVIYLHTPTIAGWSRAEMAVFLGTLFVVDALNMALFSTNFWRLPQYVLTGELDFFLLKPVSPFFLVFLRYPNVASFLNLAVALTVLGYGFSLLPPASVEAAVAYPVFLVNGLLCMLSFQALIGALAIRILAAEGIQHTFHILYQFGMKPDSIYAPMLRRILLYVFPMGLVASVPAQVVLGRASWEVVSAGLVVPPLLLLVSRFLFLRALRYYTGASA
ncbi:MAG: ABC-2 family transporter protein [Bacteroidota bacterium]|nr:ABC-2 family transporter protein [Bacteroidota bacterium]